jgi:hypothetical protein
MHVVAVHTTTGTRSCESDESVMRRGHSACVRTGNALAFKGAVSGDKVYAGHVADRCNGSTCYFSRACFPGGPLWHEIKAFEIGLSNTLQSKALWKIQAEKRHPS